MALRLMLIILSFALFSCGKETDQDKIGDAQLCLDKLKPGSTTAEVNECIEMVDGVDSPRAHAIRCSGGFIREGFADPQRYVDALEQIEGGGGASEMRDMMGILSFGSAGSINADFDNVSSTFQSCLNSGGRVSTLLSSFSFFSLGLVRFFSSAGMCAGAPTPAQPQQIGKYLVYDLAGCFANDGGAGDPVTPLMNLGDSSTGDADASAAQSSIGSVIISTHVASCSGVVTNEDLCALLSNSIDAAGGTSDPRAVAVQFFTTVLQ